jgi:hypothetical protein
MSTKAWAVERGEFAKPSDRFGARLCEKGRRLRFRSIPLGKQLF